MKKRQRALAAVALLLATGVVAGQPLRPRQGNLKVGQEAPDFTLTDLSSNEHTELQRRVKPLYLVTPSRGGFTIRHYIKAGGGRYY